MSGVDLLVLALFVLSAFAGFVRGGAREVVDFVALVGSLLIAALLYRVTEPLAKRMIEPDFFAGAAAYATTFVVFYVAIRLLGAYLGQKLKGVEVLAKVDRWAGLGLGAVRALVVLGALHLLFHAITPAERIPGWYRDSVSYPVGVFAAKTIQVILPAGARIADAAVPRATGGREQGS